MKIALTSVFKENVDFFKEKLEEYELKVYTETIQDIPLVELKDVDILSVFVFDKLDRNLLKNLKNLRFIITRSVGYDHIDVEYCKEKGIKVAHIPSYSPSSIAQHVFGMILSLVRKLKTIDRRVRKLNFKQEFEIMGFNLENLTLGVIGTGRIGTFVAKYGIAFGMRVVAYDIFEKEELKEIGVKYLTFEKVLEGSDVISVNVPLNRETYHMIGENAIKLMKDGVIFINTSRGEVVDTDALYKYYKMGKFGGIGLDVCEDEMILILERYRKGFSSDKNLKILELANKPNVIITPHIAYFTEVSMENIKNQTIEAIKAFVEKNETILKKYLIS